VFVIVAVHTAPPVLPAADTSCLMWYGTAMLGAHGRRDWLDLSDYAVHFTKGNAERGYEIVTSILWQQVLTRGPGPFGAARSYPTLTESQRAVCFSEVPLGFLGRLATRRGSPYGIGFKKGFLAKHGGGPLWYVDYGSPQHSAILQLMANAAARGGTDPIWALTPFIDFPSTDTAPYTYDFRWEREWRVCADLRFTETDVAFLVIPEHLHGQARAFFQAHIDGRTGPGYLCPYIDATWNIDRVRETMGINP